MTNFRNNNFNDLILVKLSCALLLLDRLVQVPISTFQGVSDSVELECILSICTSQVIPILVIVLPQFENHFIIYIKYNVIRIYIYSLFVLATFKFYLDNYLQNSFCVGQKKVTVTYDIH